MGYVENNLMVNEQVIYRARLHWKVLVGPVISMGLGTLLVLFSTPILSLILGLVDNYFPAMGEDLGTYAGSALACLGVLWVVSALFGFVGAATRILTSEFAVTSKRIVAKQGFLQRHTLELFLPKVEGIRVNQSLWGRLLSYGTIIVTGTGTTQEILYDIANPLEFRKQVQQQFFGGNGLGNA